MLQMNYTTSTGGFRWKQRWGEGDKKREKEEKGVSDGRFTVASKALVASGGPSNWMAKVGSKRWWW